MTIKQGIFETVRPLRRGWLEEIEQQGLQPIPIVCASVGVSFSLYVIITIFDISLRSEADVLVRDATAVGLVHVLLRHPLVPRIAVPASSIHTSRSLCQPPQRCTASMAVAAPRQTNQTAQPYPHTHPGCSKRGLSFSILASRILQVGTEEATCHPLANLMKIMFTNL